MLKKTLEQFISESKAIYGEDAFDYSKVVYVNTKTKVTLICKKCGTEFQTEPRRHLHHNSCCPYCSRRKTTEQFIAIISF